MNAKRALYSRTAIFQNTFGWAFLRKFAQILTPDMGCHRSRFSWVFSKFYLDTVYSYIRLPMCRIFQTYVNPNSMSFWEVVFTSCESSNSMCDWNERNSYMNAASILQYFSTPKAVPLSYIVYPDEVFDSWGPIDSPSLHLGKIAHGLWGLYSCQSKKGKRKCGF